MWEEEQEGNHTAHRKQAESLASAVLVWVTGTLLAMPPSAYIIETVQDRFKVEIGLWFLFYFFKP